MDKYIRIIMENAGHTDVSAVAKPVVELIVTT
jgi:hypothetical protein